MTCQLSTKKMIFFDSSTPYILKIK